MIVFHTAWDLSFLKLIATPVASDPAWQAFAMTIAGSFLALVGVGLVLAHGEGVRWRGFARRLGLVALSAAGVSAATAVAFPDTFIFFGILHMIAVGSVLALPFLRAPLLLTAAAALVVFVLPWLYRSPALDGRPLAWIGLAEAPPPSNDFEPVFPWLALVLIGIVAARVVLASPWREWFGRWQARGRLSRLLAWAGRRSLVIYLVHQPILLAVLYPLSLALGPSPAAEAAGFLRSCETSCRATGARSPETCAAACACTLEHAGDAGLRGRLLTDRLAPDELEAVRGLFQACLRDANGPRSP
jgi:uncharacterized membrane protein